MPGESLTCVWEAAHTLRPKSRDPVMATELLKEVTSQLANLPFINYSPTKFDEIFKEKNVGFDDYKDYVKNVLGLPEVPYAVLQEAIEAECWKICRPQYVSILKSLDQEDIRKLWQIFNRLALECVFPPVLSKTECLWLMERISNSLGKQWKAKHETFSEAGATFQQLLKVVDSKFLRKNPKQAVRECIHIIYCWLVKEIMKSGWLYKRSKNQANWTNWVKRWFILTPGRLTFYSSDPDLQNQATDGKVKIGEVYVNKNSKLEALQPYRGMGQVLQGRFKITNEPNIQVEMATESGLEHYAWMRAIEEVISAAKEGTTPVQKLLREKYEVMKMLLDFERLALERKATEQATPKKQRGFSRKSKKHGDQAKSDERPSADSKPSEVPADEDDMFQVTEDKMKTIFMKFDKSGNGFIEEGEFAEFVKELGLKLSQSDVSEVYNSIDTDKSGHLSFEEFSHYFSNVVLHSNEEDMSALESSLQSAFLEADRDGTGTLNFKEFAEYLWERKRDVQMSKLAETFEAMKDKTTGEVSYQQFKESLSRQNAVPNAGLATPKSSESLEQKLKNIYDSTDSEELAAYIEKRWQSFAGFKRYGASGNLVMTGDEGMVKDVVPGEYSLIDLACYSDLPPLEPKHAVVKGVKWVSSAVPGKSGKIIFPQEFDCKVPTDTATNELLRYYGCSFADSSQVKVSLLYRHGIQDFTYENEYMSDYVAKTSGGAGMEKHEFSHLDCPLADDNGTFLLGKMVSDNELHLTGFKIPSRHTLYVPGGVIHSNDSLHGTWRTMLSDEADIDHVHIVKNGKSEDEYQHFMFQFV